LRTDCSIVLLYQSFYDTLKRLGYAAIASDMIMDIARHAKRGLTIDVFEHDPDDMLDSLLTGNHCLLVPL
jgi:hypothetical protein